MEKTSDKHEDLLKAAAPASQQTSALAPQTETPPTQPGNQSETCNSRDDDDIDDDDDSDLDELDGTIPI